MSGKTWDDALAALSTTQEERDGQMLKKIADIGDALESRGTNWGELENQQAAAILEEAGIGPDDFARLVESQPEGAGADESKLDAEGKPIVETAEGGVPEGEVEFTDEVKADFKAKAQSMTEEGWLSFVNELTDAQAENVMKLLDADPEKVAAWVEAEEASYYGTMRAFADIEKAANAVPEVTAADAATAEINTLLDKHLPAGDK